MTAKPRRLRSRIITVVASLVLLACVMLSTQPAQAAGPAAAPSTAAITGRVVDNAGNPVKRATVQAKRSDGTVTTTNSDARGRFFLKGLNAGTYGLKFSDRVGLFPCPESACSEQFDDRFVTEWLGDVPTYKESQKIELTAGEKHTGVRALFDHYARISGKVTIDGRPTKIDDHVAITRYRNGKDTGGMLTEGRWFAEITRAGDWRFEVYSTTDAFAPFWIVDPRDGDTTFHSDLIEKITGVAVNVVTAG